MACQILYNIRAKKLKDKKSEDKSSGINRPEMSPNRAEIFP
jgi:hypothetical protein